MPEISRRSFLKLSSSMPFLRANASCTAVSFSDIPKTVDEKIVQAFLSTMLDTEEYVAITPNTSLFDLFANSKETLNMSDIFNSVIKRSNDNTYIDNIASSIEFICSLSVKQPNTPLSKLFTGKDAGFVLNLLKQAEEDSELYISSPQICERAIKQIHKYFKKEQVTPMELRDKIINDLLKIATQKLQSKITKEEANALNQLLPDVHGLILDYIDEDLAEKVRKVQYKLIEINSAWITELRMKKINALAAELFSGILHFNYKVQHTSQGKICFVPKITYKTDEERKLLEQAYKLIKLDFVNMLYTSLVKLYPISFKV